MRVLRKAFREFKEYDSIWEAIYLSDFFDPFFKAYYKVISFINTIKRMAYWAWVMRDNHDWDYAYVYKMLYYKLDRMDKEMIGKGHLQWQYEENKRIVRYLKAAKEAARRLGFEHIEFKFSSEIHKRYGYRSANSSLARLFSSKKVHEPISEELYHKLIKSAYKQDAAYVQYHKDVLYNSLNKFGDSWWN